MLKQHRLAAGIVCHPEVVALTGTFPRSARGGGKGEIVRCDDQMRLYGHGKSGVDLST